MTMNLFMLLLVVIIPQAFAQEEQPNLTSGTHPDEYQLWESEADGANNRSTPNAPRENSPRISSPKQNINQEPVDSVGVIQAHVSGIPDEEKKGMLEESVAEWAARQGELVYPPANDATPKDDLRENFPKCPAACGNDWVSDGWCDAECNIEECGFDGGDCEGWCNGDCRPDWIGDGHCDIGCYNAECNWDKDDCKHWREAGVPAPDRNRAASFNYEACSCSPRKIKNGVCNTECNTPECNFDGLDCLHMCSEKCAYAWLGDGNCDRTCDNQECNFDKGDCVDCGTQGCRSWMIGNGICDRNCDNAECNYDGGDCKNVTAVIAVDYSVQPEVYQFCAKEFIGDGHCDENCYNAVSSWDDGDCTGTEFAAKMAAQGIGPQFDPSRI